MNPRKSNVAGGLCPSLGFGVGRPCGWNRIETRLLRVDRQAVLAHPLGQDLHDPPGVVFSGYPDHKVVRIAYHEGFSFQARANLLLEPFIQHVVQEDIGQERANDSALRCAVVRDRKIPPPGPPR